MTYRAEYYCSYFGKCDDFTFSFLNFLTFNVYTRCSLKSNFSPLWFNCLSNVGSSVILRIIYLQLTYSKPILVCLIVHSSKQAMKQNLHVTEYEIQLKAIILAENKATFATCIKFIFSEKVTKFCEISIVDLTVTT